MAHEPTVFAMHQTRVAMPDDRVLTYYDFAARDVQPPYLKQHQGAARQHPPQRQRVLDAPPEVRWNPTLREWVVVAANRMSRPMLPSKDACPLCPAVLELPLPYQVAIFENRAPAMAYIPGDDTLPNVPEGFGLKAPSRGRCDIVVYSQEHNSKLAKMPVNDILCLVEAWRARYAELMELPEVQFVSIFENKGRDAGMTLDHPHGQIYALSYLPTLVRTQWEQTQAYSARGDDLWQSVIEREERDRVRIIAQTDGFLAGMPFYARYPYEVHIWARRQGVASLLEMTPQERRELAALLKNITCRYENLWPEPVYGFPTLMLMQQLSKISGAESFRFHIEFLPLQRSPDKLKYRASPESGIGAFLNDALPETQAQELRDTEPQELEMPDIIFEER